LIEAKATIAEDRRRNTSIRAPKIKLRRKKIGKVRIRGRAWRGSVSVTGGWEKKGDNGLRRNRKQEKREEDATKEVKKRTPAART